MNNISSMRQLYDTTSEIRLLVDMVVPDSNSLLESFFRPKKKISTRTAVTIACIFARRALPIVHEYHPNDNRSIRAVEATEKWAKQLVMLPRFSHEEIVERAHAAANAFSGSAKYAALAAAYCAETTQVSIIANIAYKIPLTAVSAISAIESHYGKEQGEKERIEQCNIFRKIVPNPYA